MWKSKPVLVFNNDLNNEVLLERLGRSYQIHYSQDLFPFSCYFPSSQVTFLLIDFIQDFEHWTEDEDFDNQKMNWLAEFVKTNDGPHLIYLCPKVDELVISVSYDLQRSIEIIVANKNISFGFATSWKAAANYMEAAAIKLSIESIEGEYFTGYQKDYNFIAKAEKIKKACLYLNNAGL